MVKIPKKFLDRAKGSLRRYQKILESAKSRDVNASGTYMIISDPLSDRFYKVDR